MSPNNDTIKREEFETFKDRVNSRLEEVSVKIEKAMGRINGLPDFNSMIDTMGRIEERIKAIDKGSMSKKDIILASITILSLVTVTIFSIVNLIPKG